MDYSPPDSSVHGILQASILEGIAMPSSIKVTHYGIWFQRFWTIGEINELYPFINAAAAAAKSFQSCPTLCIPIDGSPPGSSIPGILPARTLEWVAISFLSSAWKWKVKVKLLSHVQLLATPRTAAHQAPLSMGVSRQEYWSGSRVPSPIKLLQLYPILCDPMDCSPLGFSVHGILQVRILKWVAMPSSRRSSWPRDQTCISCISGRFFTTEPPGKPVSTIVQF